MHLGTAALLEFFRAHKNEDSLVLATIIATADDALTPTQKAVVAGLVIWLGGSFDLGPTPAEEPAPLPVAEPPPDPSAGRTWSEVDGGGDAVVDAQAGARSLMPGRGRRDPVEGRAAGRRAEEKNTVRNKA